MNSGGHILYIDDDVLVLEVGMKMLERIGYKVIGAKNSAEAIDIYRNKKDEIDLIILDYNLPDSNGLETFKKLKEIDPRVKIILSTGLTENEETLKMMKLGCRSRLQKPYSMANLSREVSGALG